MKMFLLGLASEMGDRSQITAVALGAANEVWGVIIGGSFVSCKFNRILIIGSYAMLIGWGLARRYIYEQNICREINYIWRRCLPYFRC